MLERVAGAGALLPDYTQYRKLSELRLKFKFSTAVNVTPDINGDILRFNIHTLK